MQKILSMEISIEINANLCIQTLFSYNTNTNQYQPMRRCVTIILTVSVEAAV